MQKISLIIPTYNREKYLRQALTSFFNQSLDKNLYEIILVDNNSSDNTKEIVLDLFKETGHKCRYVFEPRQGLHHARNRGITEAENDIIVFGDDDIKADTYWLQNILKEFETQPETGVTGGPVFPKWDNPPAEWVWDYGSPEKHGVFAILDLGSERKVLDKNEFVFGCNFAIRKELALKIGGSQPDTYPDSLTYLSGYGEYGMILDARKLGTNIVYIPEAKVHHNIETSRINLRYFLKRYKRWAIEDVYYNFRYYGKQKAIKKILNESFSILKNTMKFKNKINKNYFFILNTTRSVHLLIQLARVLLDKTLYAHITQESYL